MPDWFYAIRLAGTEELARLSPTNVDKWLVQLICENHACFHEFGREASARAVAMSAAKHSYGSEATADIGHAEANRYTGDIPTNLGEATFPAPCGCRAWHGW